MKKNVKFGLIFLFGVSFLSFFNAPDKQWAIRYDAWSPSGGMQQTQDGGYIVPLEGYLVKISAAGFIEWQYTYPGHTTNSVASTLEGGCIAAGETRSYYGKSLDISVMKLSAWGEVEWQKSYNSPYDDLRKEVAHSIQQTNDGGYIVAGYALEYGPWNSTSHILFLKLTSSGEQEWHQEYTYRTFEGLNQSFSIQQTSDNGFIAVGFVGAIRHEERLDICILKLSPQGEIEWIKLYGGERREEAYSIQQTADGGYIVAGNESSFPGQRGALILKLSFDGQIEWQKSYKRDVPICANYICQTPDGGYAVAGSGYNRTGIWFLKLAQDGAVEWQKDFDRETNGAAYSIQPLDEGGYAVYAGIEHPFWFTDHYNYFDSPLVLKLDASGEISDSCFLIQDTNAAPLNTDIVPQEILVMDGQPSHTDYFVEEKDIEQRAQTKEFTLLCGEADLNSHFPPINFYGEKVFNRSLSQAEYLNILSWEENPRNAQILKYKIYQLENGFKNLIAELDGRVLKFWHHNVNKNEEQKYLIVSIDDQDRESNPAFLKIHLLFSFH
ncbi:MAG: hypothetical protein MUP98_07855 [Candidatus Aminicenantes bacterium]|nr:hypothetical protein [Candidatus Aminicenantes bacterium]